MFPLFGCFSFRCGFSSNGPANDDVLLLPLLVPSPTDPTTHHDNDYHNYRHPPTPTHPRRYALVRPVLRPAFQMWLEETAMCRFFYIRDSHNVPNIVQLEYQVTRDVAYHGSRAPTAPGGSGGGNASANHRAGLSRGAVAPSATAAAAAAKAKDTKGAGAGGGAHRNKKKRKGRR